MAGESKTYKIIIWGVVQGVGFRPFVAKLAGQMELKGEVRNMGGLVELIVTDSVSQIETLIRRLHDEKPEPAEIVHIKVSEIQYREFEDFRIVDSKKSEDQIIMLPPDLAICPQCAQDAENPKGRRYRHPFVSCMICGPRYTIVDNIPYDRENTSMADFPMCGDCHREYTDRIDMRYHAQTISCHDCGPVLFFEMNNNTLTSIKTEEMPSRYDMGVAGECSGNGVAQNEAAIAAAVSLIQGGHIIALKGIGGYYFACSAMDESAVRDLRRLKGREEKPFAVMFRDIAQLRTYCLINEVEEKLICSGARPIVLLERRRTDIGVSDTICPEVYRSSRYVGAFLPAMALQTMLIEQSEPLVMTSANISDDPIIKDDEAMLKFLRNAPLLSAVFYHRRSIRVRAEDSVVRVIDGQPQITRRAKGYVPTPVYIGGANHFDSDGSNQCMILAVGGQLKSAFCLTRDAFAYVSQYFGDLESLEATRIYEENIERMKSIFDIEPNVIVCDLHPGYFTTEFAYKYLNLNEEKMKSSSGTTVNSKTDQKVNVIHVQHHHAHVASVMAENGLTDSVIGVSFDGTGYGTDGAIWGGEFLICTGATYERAAHLAYTRMIGGDNSMRQGWKSAMCYLHQQEYDTCHAYLQDGRYQIVSKALDANLNAIHSSSMGRLFDAVAALAGIHEENRYEGECAIMLENYAASAIDDHVDPVGMGFSHIDRGNSQMVQLEGEAKSDEREDKIIIDAAPVIRAVIDAVEQGCSKAAIALGFHLAVSEMICDICIKLRDLRKINRVALSGGVFQNKILMEGSLRLLRTAGFDVYYNISVPPNDGGICLGQAYVAHQHLYSRV